MNRIITIGREFGSGGRELGYRIAEKLQIAYYDQEIITEIAKRTALSEDYIRQIEERRPIMHFPIHTGHSFYLTSEPSFYPEFSIYTKQHELLRELSCKSDCIIVCMDGVTVVNDAADEDDFDSICAALERRGVQRIDYLVLSHYDKDHIGSAAALVRAYPVGQILGPDYEENSMYLLAEDKVYMGISTVHIKLYTDYSSGTVY